MARTMVIRPTMVARGADVTGRREGRKHRPRPARRAACATMGGDGRSTPHGARRHRRDGCRRLRLRAADPRPRRGRRRRADADDRDPPRRPGRRRRRHEETEPPPRRPTAPSGSPQAAKRPSPAARPRAARRPRPVTPRSGEGSAPGRKGQPAPVTPVPPPTLLGRPATARPSRSPTSTRARPSTCSPNRAARSPSASATRPNSAPRSPSRWSRPAPAGSA